MEESAGIVKITIPDQRSQAETKLRGKGSPDPGGAKTSASPCLGKRRSTGIINPIGFWFFFNKGPKFIYLDLRKLEISEVHVADLLPMQCGGGERSPNGIKFDLQNSRSSTKAQTLSQQLEAHKYFLLGTSETKEGSPLRLEKALPQVRHRKSRASTSDSVGAIGDDIAQTFLTMMLTVRIGTTDIKEF